MFFIFHKEISSNVISLLRKPRYLGNKYETRNIIFDLKFKKMNNKLEQDHSYCQMNHEKNIIGKVRYGNSHSGNNDSFILHEDVSQYSVHYLWPKAMHQSFFQRCGRRLFSRWWKYTPWPSYPVTFLHAKIRCDFHQCNRKMDSIAKIFQVFPKLDSEKVMTWIFFRWIIGEMSTRQLLTSN